MGFRGNPAVDLQAQVPGRFNRWVGLGEVDRLKAVDPDLHSGPDGQDPQTIPPSGVDGLSQRLLLRLVEHSSAA